MLIYLIYGPQGSGKSTQAKLISEKFGYKFVSAGDVSRQIAAEDSDIGRRVKSLYDSGNPTPQEIIVPAIDRVLDTPGSTGFVLDGYPRYAQQIESLVESIEKRGWQVTKVVSILLSDEDCKKRMASRARLENRNDDVAVAIARRLELYHQQTVPIIHYFQKLGLVVEIDGSGTIEEVHQLILQSLND